MDAETQIRALRVRSIFERLLGTSLITVVNGSLMTTVLEGTGASEGPWVWLGLVVAVAAARIATRQAYLRGNTTSANLSLWEAVAFSGSLLSGVLWGVGAAVLFPVDQTDQLLWILLIGGMCAGAASLHAAHAPTAMAFIIPAALPLAASFAWRGSGHLLAAAAMIVVFVVALCFTVRRFSFQFGEMLRLQIQLERRTTELDEVNRCLSAEIENHRATEETLRQAQKMEAIGQLTGGIAHDFNNLLTTITGNLELIRRQAPENGEVVRLARAAEKAADRGARLTGSLLSFARKQTLRPERVDVNRLIDAFMPLLERAVGETVQVRLELAAAAPDTNTDAAHLHSALLNLVINARDAMPQGGNLTISTRNAAPDAGENAYVVIAVEDEGVGMAPEVAAKAFEPFFTTKDVGKGSGLGLSQVYGFAQQSGGYATIVSRPGMSLAGGGTTVSIFLPALAAAAATEAPRPAATRPVEVQPGRVLLVEDDAELRATLREALARSGWDVIAVPDGRVARDLLDRDPAIAMLVTDVLMPGGVSGVELARAAAKLRPGLPVLLMSGYPNTILAAEGAVEGEFRLLQKPFSQAQLEEGMLVAAASRGR